MQTLRADGLPLTAAVPRVPNSTEEQLLHIILVYDLDQLFFSHLTNFQISSATEGKKTFLQEIRLLLHCINTVFTNNL